MDPFEGARSSITTRQPSSSSVIDTVRVIPSTLEVLDECDAVPVLELLLDDDTELEDDPPFERELLETVVPFGRSIHRVVTVPSAR